MKKIAGLFGIAVLVSGTLVFAPDISYSAQKGKAASGGTVKPPGKTTAVAKKKRGIDQDKTLWDCRKPIIKINPRPRT
jgi:hypothetical protein